MTEPGGGEIPHEPIEQQLQEEVAFAKLKARARNQQQGDSDRDIGWEKELIGSFLFYVPGIDPPDSMITKAMQAQKDIRPIDANEGNLVGYSRRYLDHTIGDFLDDIKSAIDQVGVRKEMEKLAAYTNRRSPSEPNLSKSAARKNLERLMVPVYMSLRRMGYNRRELTT